MSCLRAPAALQTLGPASILLFVPVYDRAVVPALRWATGNPSGLSMLQRVGAGMAVSLAGVAVAALVEARRLAMAREHGLVDDPSATVPMSWAWIVPQYAMMGVADVLAVVGLQELFYDQMPPIIQILAPNNFRRPPRGSLSGHGGRSSRFFCSCSSLLQSLFLLLAPGCIVAMHDEDSFLVVDWLDRELGRRRTFAL